VATYNYSREIVDNLYDIDNVARVDGEGNQIYLAQEIEAALPGKNFNVVCNGADAAIIFTEDLTAEEQTTLGTIVSNHKNNV
jgi:hypothetical protein